MKHVKLFEEFLNEAGVRVDFSNRRNVKWNIKGIRGDYKQGLVILVASESKSGEPSWWTLATVQDGEIKFHESELGEIAQWAKDKAHREAKIYGHKNLEEVSESLVNEGIDFDKTLHAKVLKAIMSTKTYMDIEDMEDPSEIFLSTRENGDVGSETPGRADIKEADRVQKILQKKFPELKFTLDTTDEWTNLHIQNPKPVEYEYEYRQWSPDKSWDTGGESFNTFDEMVKYMERKYKLEGVDWKAIQKELDNITEFPRDLFVGWHRSALIPLAQIGEFGNNSPWNLYVAKKKSDQ
jgi:hypothetical protein